MTLIIHLLKRTQTNAANGYNTKNEQDVRPAHFVSYAVCFNQVGNAEELQIASFRNDGTLRKSVVVWVVLVGDDLDVRSVNGRNGAWFRGMQERPEGHIRAGGFAFVFVV